MLQEGAFDLQREVACLSKRPTVVPVVCNKQAMASTMPLTRDIPSHTGMFLAQTPPGLPPTGRLQAGSLVEQARIYLARQGPRREALLPMSAAAWSWGTGPGAER